MDADGVLAGGFELEQRPRFAEPVAPLAAGFPDQTGREQPAGDVGDRLPGQPGHLGELDPAQLLFGTADRVEHHGVVEPADPIQIGPPAYSHSSPRRHGDSGSAPHGRDQS
jgi:hypothetical protein